MAAKTTKPKATQNGAPDVVTINVAIPRDLHRALRVRAVMEDMTMTEAITAAVTEWTAE
jgi:hypothetical protein